VAFLWDHATVPATRVDAQHQGNDGIAAGNIYINFILLKNW